MKTFFLCLFAVLLSAVSCRTGSGGALLIYGNLFSKDCKDPISDARIYMVDAVFHTDGSVSQVIELDSLITTEQGRFEFVYGSVEPINDPGFVIESENGAFVVKMPYVGGARYLNFDICQE
jgi:hypothetical protein